MRKDLRGVQMKNYETEARSRWGATDAYREHEQKTKNYTKEKWTEANDGLMAIFAEFTACRANGASADSTEVQALVAKLQAGPGEYRSLSTGSQFLPFTSPCTSTTAPVFLLRYQRIDYASVTTRAKASLSRMPQPIQASARRTTSLVRFRSPCPSGSPN